MSEHRHHRRRTLAVLTACVGGLCAALLTPVLSAQASTGLAAAAEAKGRYFGTATDQSELSDSAYVSILTGGEFDFLTPGNAMKWQNTEPTQGVFNYTNADSEVALAAANNMKVRAHTLVWHNQLAGWVTSLPLTSVQAAMENHITNEVTHFKGKVYSWDVVNEPFNDDGTYRADVFYNAMGTAYIADAFRTARAADPTAKLYINDYNIEGSGAKSDAMYALVSSLVAQGVPIDGVGFQGHLATQYGFPSGMTANMQRFANLGLDVAITELDVRQPLPETAAQDATQITYYQNVVSSCLAVTRCVGITIWDFTDKYTWVTSTFPGQGVPLPWDANLAKKPALYNAILTSLGATPPTTSTSPPVSTTTTPPVPGACTASYSTVNSWPGGFQGSVTVTAGSSKITSWSVTWTLPSGQTLSQVWNGTLTMSGTTATVKNASYNGTLNAAGSTTFGFLGTGTPSTPALTCTAA
jgi:endo-1,4-beta-xylanase